MGCRDYDLYEVGVLDRTFCYATSDMVLLPITYIITLNYVAGHFRVDNGMYFLKNSLYKNKFVI